MKAAQQRATFLASSPSQEASMSLARPCKLAVTEFHFRIKVALRLENQRSWHEVEQDFLESEYRAVRDRQMRELEQEDDLLNKVPVR